MRQIANRESLSRRIERAVEADLSPTEEIWNATGAVCFDRDRHARWPVKPKRDDYAAPVKRRDEELTALFQD